MTANIDGLKITVRGIVQGVGFRPFIYGLAELHHLTGWVRNTSNGVEIEINGPKVGLEKFLSSIYDNPPILARVDEIHTQPCIPDGYSSFTIHTSQPSLDDFLPVSPDMSICPECQVELFTPRNRRFHYPFINCTNCGPRFSIIKDIPYDRPLTTMAAFKMCPECQAEYDDPHNRRFHAQPTACPACGPQLAYEEHKQILGVREEALQLARKALQEGKIIAVKGVGGYHLACDATNPASVEELRRRKKRSDKPFALMAFDVATVKRYCQVTPQETELLLSHQHPILVLDRIPDSQIAPETAPYQSTVAMMLPYTPMHLLLLEPAYGFPEALVMTSGNLSEEPLAFEDEDARNRLQFLADGYLLHDRPIHMRVDDSVIRIVNNHSHFLRRSRGYAPDPIQLPYKIPSTLAVGAELKNTFCLTRDAYAFLSHHIGDMQNYETLLSFEQGIDHFKRLFRIQPELIACDLHPDYLATRYAVSYAKQEKLPLIKVQHHHAHLAACLADNHWATNEPVIGVTFDGTGLGTDGAIWGSEFLVGAYANFFRFAHLSYVPLPGGDIATRKPARMALAHLWQAGIDWESDLPPVESLCYDEKTALRAQLIHQLNSPFTSSMGRLFDAASSLIGVCQVATYEGQAAIQLESIAEPNETGLYFFDIRNGLIDPAPVLRGLISDWRLGFPPSILSARFHNSVVKMTVDVSTFLQHQTGINTIALSGGVWQNRYLLEHACRALEGSGFTVLTHHQVPANDGCIALGQAFIAASAGRVAH